MAKKTKPPKVNKPDEQLEGALDQFMEEIADEVLEEVDLENMIKKPITKSKAISIILGILVVGSLMTCGVAALLEKKDTDVSTEPDIPASPPMPPVELSVESVGLDVLEPVIEEVLVTPDPVMEPPDVPSYGVAPGFDCAFIVGSWSDKILLDAQDRSCDVVVIGYMGSDVWYYDVGFNLMQNISHRYH